MITEPYLGVKEAAAYLMLHTETVRRMAREGTIPAVKFGRSWRFKVSVLDQWARETPIAPLKPPIPRVLCVDDDALILRMYDLIFANESLDLVLARNLAEAQQAIDESEPNCLIVDLKLGGGETGVDLLRRNVAMLDRMPVLIVTAYPDSELLNEAIQLTPVTMLIKPMQRDRVIAAVNRAILSHAGHDLLRLPRERR